MSRRPGPPSTTASGVQLDQLAEEGGVRVAHRTEVEGLGEPVNSAEVPLPCDAWKSSDLAHHLIDCLKDANAQRH